jgi:serine/threonine protein kinase
MSQEPPDPLVGTVFGGARIQQRVSKGLLADVYMGHHERLAVPVAVKILSPKAMAQGVNKDRFVREGRALATLAHPNIIKIYNVGQEQGRCFIIMDWIQDGMNLRQLAQTRPLTPAQSLKVVQRLCDALEYIHSQKLIHRDIKPANICLRRGGHPVLMDFSLIKDQSSDVQLTAPGTIMGTVNFMPPEQAQPGGPFGDVSVRSDVYSLGGTLYWLLTGKPPFKGRTPMETIIKLMREQPQPPSAHNASVPQVVDQLVLDTLAKKQDVRPQTARDLAARIEQIFQVNRIELEAAQRPAPSTEDGPPPAATQSGAGSGRHPAPQRWGAGSSAADVAPPPDQQQQQQQQQAPVPTRPLAPIPGLAHHAPPQQPPQLVPSGAPAYAGPQPAYGQQPAMQQQPAGGVAVAPAPDPGLDAAADPLGQGMGAPPPPNGPDGPHDAFAPTASTEGAAAGLLKLPPELREAGRRPPKPAGPPVLLIAFLVLVIVAGFSVAAAVFFFDVKLW